MVEGLGLSGGLGIVDHEGHYFASRRWDQRSPITLFHLLQSINDMVVVVYLENINLPSTGDDVDNRWSAGSNLLVNSGIWQGWCMALSLQVVQIPPATWQAAHGLFRWQSRLKKHPNDPTIFTPLTYARRLFPAASLEFKADDGQAVGLLLAALAYSDDYRRIDRTAIQAVAVEKKKRVRREARKLAKAARALPGIQGGAEHGYF